MQAHVHQVNASLAGSLWVPPPLAQQVAARLGASLQVLATLVARLQGAQAGFAALPVDAGLAGDAPAPVHIAA